MDPSSLKVGVMGAGLIGGYLGGSLALAGVDVGFVARERTRAEWGSHGLRLTDLNGRDGRVSPERLQISSTPEPLSSCDVVLVTVKSGQTAQVAAQLRDVLPASTLVVSFQNGVGNGDVLRAVLGNRVLRAMVPFNVVSKQPGHLHRGTSGALVVESNGREGALVQALRAAGLEARGERDILAVLWGKLLLNLNNSVNALAGIPLKAELEQRGYRRVLAACMEEGLAALRRAGIRPKVDVPLPPAWLPSLLRLPTPVFRVLAARMIRIDPAARSSMLEDLSSGRVTEIDALNGEVLRLAEAHGTPAPVNAAVMRAVRAAEGQGSPHWSAEELGRRCDLSQRPTALEPR